MFNDKEKRLIKLLRDASELSIACQSGHGAWSDGENEYENIRHRFEPIYKELEDIAGVSLKHSSGSHKEDNEIFVKEVDQDLFISVKCAIDEITDLLDTLY